MFPNASKGEAITAEKWNRLQQESARQIQPQSNTAYQSIEAKILDIYDGDWAGNPENVPYLICQLYDSQVQSSPNATPSTGADWEDSKYYPWRGRISNPERVYPSAQAKGFVLDAGATVDRSANEFPYRLTLTEIFRKGQSLRVYSVNDVWYFDCNPVVPARIVLKGEDEDYYRVTLLKLNDDGTDWEDGSETVAYEIANHPMVLQGSTVMVKIGNPRNTFHYNSPIILKATETSESSTFSAEAIGPNEANVEVTATFYQDSAELSYSVTEGDYLIGWFAGILEDDLPKFWVRKVGPTALTTEILAGLGGASTLIDSDTRYLTFNQDSGFYSTNTGPATGTVDINVNPDFYVVAVEHGGSEVAELHSLNFISNDTLSWSIVENSGKIDIEGTASGGGVPVVGSDPVSPSAGEVWFNSSQGFLKIER